MQEYVIIVAGGSGKRFGSNLPKQFLPLGGKPLLLHTMEKFYSYSEKISILLVLPCEHIPYWNVLCAEHHISIPHILIEGGDERFFSVKNGLQNVPCGALVAIHDGVRPFVNCHTIEKCFYTAKKEGNAIPVVSVNDTVRVLSVNGSAVLDRSSLRAVQTPQVFVSDVIKKAYEQPYNNLFTDDASVVEAMGEVIHLVDGECQNIKITSPIDFAWADFFMSNLQEKNKIII